MKGILVVSTPMQFINAIEYLRKHNLDTGKFTLFIATRNRESYNIIEKMNDYNWQMILKHCYFFKKGSITNFFNSLITWFRIYPDQVKSRWSHVIVGHYAHPIHRFFLRKGDKNIIVDDGIFSLEVYKLRKKEYYEGQIETYSPDILNSFINKLWNYKQRIETPIEFFTIYNICKIDIDTIEPNHYSYLKEKLQTLANKKVLLFIGSDVVEKGLLDKNLYLDYIDKLIKEFKDFELWYCPKKSEDLIKFDNLKDKIKFIEEVSPVELVPLYYQCIPLRIGSFFSSALFSLHNIIASRASYFYIDIRPHIKHSEKYNYIFKSYENLEENVKDFKKLVQ